MVGSTKCCALFLAGFECSSGAHSAEFQVPNVGVMVVMVLAGLTPNRGEIKLSNFVYFWV